MTTTDLEREIAKLLPCDGSMGKCDTHAVGSAQGWNGHWHDCPASHRPAILAYVERKVAEASADSGLLGKLEKRLREVGGIDLIETDEGTITAVTGEDGPGFCEARTLAEALRGLVEEKP